MALNRVRLKTPPISGVDNKAGVWPAIGNDISAIFREVTPMIWFFASLLLLPLRLIFFGTKGILLHLLMAIGLGMYVLGR